MVKPQSKGKMEHKEKAALLFIIYFLILSLFGFLLSSNIRLPNIPDKLASVIIAFVFLSMILIMVKYHYHFYHATRIKKK